MEESLFKNEFPKTWEEFCEKSDLKLPKEFHPELFPSQDREIAESYFALGQLRLLRNEYVNGWKPRYGKEAYIIIIWYNGVSIKRTFAIPSMLSFPTMELAREFLNNFESLIEKIYPLFK